jgi:hypothetical protein
MAMSLLLYRLLETARQRLAPRSERGFSTAELLASAALAVVALAAIWLALTNMGRAVITWIQAQLIGG